ncbi:MAG TPA: class I SAM-dependent methyltransferase [Streptosporangiaceae bacterium]|nr:class I SAM-dependent methyltransferase [Streptosporangiaceae bacterium]
MDLGFGGEVADLYHMYRHGYPAEAIDLIAGAFGLDGADLVVDLGCGTGQLTLPLARRVRAAVGIDPEPDMLRRASEAAREAGIGNVSWMLGADASLPGLVGLFGAGSAGAVTIGQALHWMRPDELFAAAVPLLRRGGGVAVVTNGTPLWLQDSSWSQGLRSFLERWLATRLTFHCGTDGASQERYAQALARAGFEVTSAGVDYEAELSLDQVVGGVYSAIPVDRLPPPGQRGVFAQQVRAAIGPQDRFTEPVHVAILTGRLPPGLHDHGRLPTLCARNPP